MLAHCPTRVGGSPGKVLSSDSGCSFTQGAGTLPRLAVKPGWLSSKRPDGCSRVSKPSGTSVFHPQGIEHRN
jgi:hypothetical protein